MKYALFLFLTLPSLFLLPLLPERIESAELVVVENDWPPYYFGNNSEQLPGFARELLDICLPRTGHRPVYRFYPVRRMYSYLEKGRLDIALFSYKEEREEFVYYGSEPIFTSSYRPVVRKGSGIEIQTLADFDPLRLGHLAGLRYSPAFLDYVKEREMAGRLVITTDGRDYLRLLLSGIIDVFVETRETVLWRAQRLGVSGEITILDYDIKSSEYFVTVSKQTPRLEDPRSLLKSLDSCFIELKDSGRYTEIAEKYGID